jgi:hypothetical protein
VRFIDYKQISRDTRYTGSWNGYTAQDHKARVTVIGHGHGHNILIGPGPEALKNLPTS